MTEFYSKLFLVAKYKNICMKKCFGIISIRDVLFYIFYHFACILLSLVCVGYNMFIALCFNNV